MMVAGSDMENENCKAKMGVVDERLHGRWCDGLRRVTNVVGIDL